MAQRKPLSLTLEKPIPNPPKATNYYNNVCILLDGKKQQGFLEGRNKTDGCVVWIKVTPDPMETEYMYPHEGFRVFSYTGMHIYTLTEFDLNIPVISNRPAPLPPLVPATEPMLLNNNQNEADESEEDEHEQEEQEEQEEQDEDDDSIVIISHNNNNNNNDENNNNNNSTKVNKNDENNNNNHHDDEEEEQRIVDKQTLIDNFFKTIREKLVSKFSIYPEEMSKEDQQVLHALCCLDVSSLEMIRNRFNLIK